MDFQLSTLSQALNEEVGTFAHSDLAAILRAHRGETGSDRLTHREAGTVLAAALLGLQPADALEAVGALRLESATIPLKTGPAVVLAPEDVADHPAASVIRPTFAEALAQLLFHGGARLDLLSSPMAVASIEMVAHAGERCAVLHLLLAGYTGAARYGSAAPITGLALRVTAPGDAFARVGASAYAMTAAAPVETGLRIPAEPIGPDARLLH